jgi:radical SAM protein with 4Fe4S-binding SPASM domain
MADGRVPITPCVYLHNLSTGDLLREDVFDILASPAFDRLRRRNAEIPTACREADCRFAEQCRGGCAARTYFIAGTIDAPDPYCPLRFLDLGGQIPALPIVPNGRPGRVRVHEDYLCTWIGAPAAVP